MPRSAKPRRRPAQDRSKHTVEAILQAAIQVFSRFGYAATTTQIAKRAGVSVGSLYQYYRNKDALLVELYLRHARQAHARAHEILDDVRLVHEPLEHVCYKLSEAIVTLHLHDPKLHRVLAEHVPNVGAYKRAKAREEKALFEKALKLFSAHPEVKVGDPVRATLMVGHLLESLSHWYVLEAPQLALDTHAFIAEQARVIALYLGASNLPASRASGGEA